MLSAKEPCRKRPAVAFFFLRVKQCDIRQLAKILQITLNVTAHFLASICPCAKVAFTAAADRAAQLRPRLSTPIYNIVPESYGHKVQLHPVLCRSTLGLSPDRKVDFKGGADGALQRSPHLEG
jgi:hypothetical protein